MHGLLDDLTVAARYLRKTPGFTFPAVLTLALGIGAMGSVATLADAVLVRPLAVRDADRIVHVFQRRDEAPPGAFPLAYADYLDYRADARSFSALAAHYPTSPMQVIVAGQPVSLTGAVVTANYFDVLSLEPAAGRFFGPAEDRVRGRDAVMVIGHAFWQQHFGGDPGAIGAALTVNGTRFTVVGVMPEGFTGVHPRGNETALWIPTAMFAAGYRFCDPFARDCTIVHMLGKLRPGVTVADAQAELEVIARRLQAEYPATNAGSGVRVVRARGLGYGEVAEENRQLALYAATVAIVLVVVCANITGLLLARGAERQREIATRLALGATRRRVARQLLTESVLLAAIGGGAGLLVAAWGNAMLESVYALDAAGRPVAFSLTMRGGVVAATAGIAVVSAVVFGLLPSIRATRTNLMTAIKPGGGSGLAAGSRLRQALVSAQVALSVVLVVTAALLIASAGHLLEGPGVRLDSLVTMRLRPSLIDYSRERAHAYQREVLERLEAVPGVVGASPSVYLPLGTNPAVGVSTDPSATRRATASVQYVGGSYFETLGLPLSDGREFRETDRLGAPPVAVVNEVLATRLWPDSRAVGQSLWLGDSRHTVIGVVPDAQYYAAGESPRPQVFFSYWQTPADEPFFRDSRTLVRVAGNPAQRMPALRRAAASVDPRVPVAEDQLLRDRIEFGFRRVTLARTLIAGLAALALLLSGMGVYGVVSFSVTRRTREIGIRMALGARRSRIAAMVLREGLAMTFIGASLGVAGSVASTRLIGNLLYGVRSGDTLAFAVAPALLVAVAAAASYLPARRAADVPPSQALRAE